MAFHASLSGSIMNTVYSLLRFLPVSAVRISFSRLFSSSKDQYIIARISDGSAA